MIGWALILWVLAVNVVAFLAFGLDKQLAQRGAWRLSEAYLLMLAMLGGWVGAKAGQRWFRHKTRKQPFADKLNVSLLLPLLAVLALTTPMLSAIAKLAGPSAGSAEAKFPHRFGPGSSD